MEISGDATAKNTVVCVICLRFSW